MKQTYQSVKEKEAIAVFYTGNFLIDFTDSLTFAVYVVFLYKNGLDLLQVNLINMLFMIAIVFLQVPTGAIADLIGRKKAVLFASLLAIIGYTLYPVYRNVYNFAIAELIIAISMSFSSGAFEAWMVESSTKQGFKGKFDLIFSQNNIYAKVATIVGGLSGAYLATIDLAMPFYVGGFLSILVFTFLYIYMVDDSRELVTFKKIKPAFSKLVQISKDAITYSVSRKVIIWVVLGGALIAFACQPLNMYWGIKFNDMLQDRIYLLGWIWAIIALFSLFGAQLTKYLIEKNKNYSQIMTISILIIVPSVLIAAGSSLAAAVFTGFMIHEFGRGLLSPIQRAYINDQAEESKRATIFSFDSMSSAAGSAVGLLIFGLIAKAYGINVSWIIAAFVFLLAIPFYLKADSFIKKS